METFDDFRRRRFGGDLAASSASGLEHRDPATAVLLRHRLHVIYETPSDDFPDEFRALLTRMSSKLDTA